MSSGHHLHQDREREQPQAPQRRTGDGQENDEEDQADALEDDRRHVRHHDQQLAPQRESSDQRRVLDDGPGRADQSLVEPEPGNQSGDQKIEVGLVPDGRRETQSSSRNHEGEDKPIEKE